MTASATIDRRIDYTGTLANLIATIPTAGFPAGTWAFASDFGFVTFNGTGWVMQNSTTLAGSATLTQAAGTPVTSELCNVTGAAAVAVTLPASAVGMVITIHMTSAFACSVFPNAGGTTTEKINALGANAAIVMGSNTSAQFTCAVAGQWFTVPRTPS
jgi:hypothetical protein